MPPWRPAREWWKQERGEEDAWWGRRLREDLRRVAWAWLHRGALEGGLRLWVVPTGGKRAGLSYPCIHLSPAKSLHRGGGGWRGNLRSQAQWTLHMWAKQLSLQSTSCQRTDAKAGCLQANVHWNWEGRHRQGKRDPGGSGWNTSSIHFTPHFQEHNCYSINGLCPFPHMQKCILFALFLRMGRKDIFAFHTLQSRQVLRLSLICSSESCFMAINWDSQVCREIHPGPRKKRGCESLTHQLTPLLQQPLINPGDSFTPISPAGQEVADVGTG